jgi:hypothetical protein
MSDSVAQQLRLSTAVTNLVLRCRVLSRENMHQLKIVLRQNTVLVSLDFGGEESWERRSGRDCASAIP